MLLAWVVLAIKCNDICDISSNIIDFKVVFNKL